MQQWIGLLFEGNAFFEGELCFTHVLVSHNYEGSDNNRRMTLLLVSLKGQGVTSFTQRNPKSLNLVVVGTLLFRLATRTFSALHAREPLRNTRLD